MAGGCLLKKEKIKDFKNFLNNRFKKNFKNLENQKLYISEQNLESLISFAKNALQNLAPFGNNNLIFL